MKLTLGEMLYRFRMEKNIAAKKLCSGICSPAMISLMENNERVPDILQFIYFVERMGISPEHCSIMVTKTEYLYLEWRNETLDAIEKSDWVGVKELLRSDIPAKTWCNKKIEMQFFYYASGIYEASLYNYKTATELLEKAAKQTVPEPSKVAEGKVLLSTLELNIFMLYLYYGVKGNCLTPEEARIFFSFLEHYVYSGILEGDEQAKIYPKLICIGILSIENFTEEEKREYLEKSICLAREDKTFHDLTEVLRMYIQLLEKEKDEKLGFYKTHYKVFCDLLESEGYDTTFRPEMMAFSRANYYLLEEYLESERKAKGMTQAELSEGICEPETYSRMVNGKQIPSRKNMQALSERLEIRWNYYRGEIDTCNSKAFQLRLQHRIAAIEERYNDSLDLLQQLKTFLDMTIVENYQYIKSNEIILNQRLSLLTAEEAYDELEKVLSITLTKESVCGRGIYYSQTELEIIGHMAQFLKIMGKYEEGISLLLPVIKRFEKSKLDFESQSSGYYFLLSILGVLYFRIKEYDLCIKCENELKINSIRLRAGDSLAFLYDAIADAFEHKGIEYADEYKKMYRDTYYFADFFHLSVIKKGAQSYYEDNFEPHIKWYE